MINLEKELKRTQSDARILLQIHDELLVTTTQQSRPLVQKSIKEILERVVTWDVPLVVDIRSGRTWQDTTK
jgi:DNA polymerase-1